MVSSIQSANMKSSLKKNPKRGCVSSLPSGYPHFPAQRGCDSSRSRVSTFRVGPVHRPSCALGENADIDSLQHTKVAIAPCVVSRAAVHQPCGRRRFAKLREPPHGPTAMQPGPQPCAGPKWEVPQGSRVRRDRQPWILPRYRILRLFLLPLPSSLSHVQLELSFPIYCECEFS